MSWNPNRADGCVYGMEWLPQRQADRPVSGTGAASYAWTMDSTASETVNRMWTYSGQAVPNAYDTIDIYDVDDLAPAIVERDTYIVTGDGNAARGLRRTGVAWTGAYNSGTDITTLVNAFRMGAGQLNRTWASLVDDTTFTSAPFKGFFSNAAPPPDLSGAFFDPVQVLNREFIGLTPWRSSLYDAGFDFVSQFSQWPFLIDNMETGLSGRRILGLTVSCIAQRIIDPRALSSEFDKPVRLRPAIYVGGTLAWGQAFIAPAQPQTISYTWFTNPTTGLPWTATELQAFDSTNEVLWLMSRPNDPQVIDAVGGAIYQVSATVSHCAETREATARRVNAQQVQGWNEWNVTAIGGGSWSKASGEKYLFNARLDEQQAVDWRPTLSNEGLSVRALGDGVGDANGVNEVAADYLETVPRNDGTPTGWAPAVVLQRTDNDYSVDGQPYSVLRDFYTLGVVRDPGTTLLWQTLEVDTDPDRLRFYARSESASVPQNNLIVYVLDTGANVIAQTPVVTPAMLVQPGDWQLFDLPLELVGAWATPDTYVALAVVDGDGTGWSILTLTDGSDEPGAAPADPVYPGRDIGFESTGAFPLAVYGGDPAAFRAGTATSLAVGVEPVAPTGLTVTYYGFDDNDPLGFGFPCYTIEWDGQDGTEDCSDVAYYEIQRGSTVNGPLATNTSDFWQTIFRVEVDGTAETYTAIDVENVRQSPGDGTATDYRIRVVSTTGFVSAWTEAIAPAPDPDDRCGYLFTSNVLPFYNQWYMDIGERSYEMLETVRYYEFEGRDGALPVRGLTDRLDSFDVQLMVAADGAVSPLPDVKDFQYGNRGRAQFQGLSYFAGNKMPPGQDYSTPPLLRRPLRLPYLCVLDNRGNRWFASVETPRGVEQEPGGRHFYRVSVREVSKVPTVVTLVESEAFGYLVSEFVAEYASNQAEPPAPPLPSLPGS